MVLDADALVGQIGSMTATFGDQAKPRADGVPSGSGSEQSHDREGVVCSSDLPHGQRPAGAPPRIRILTPHPGEMARLTGKTTAEVQADRIGAARTYAMGHGVTLVLKGQRTVIAFPDGRGWINPTGTPAMGKGGTGDILTGMIAGLLGQFPKEPGPAIAAAVYLHGLAGELGAAALTEKCLTATDLLRYLPAALEECARLPHRL